MKKVLVVGRHKRVKIWIYKTLILRFNHLATSQTKVTADRVTCLNSGELIFFQFAEGKTLLQKGESSVSADVVLKKKTLILYYFTVNENEACRNFDEKLFEVYQQAMIRKIELGVVTVPCDTDHDSFINNIKSHYLNWFSVQFGDDLIHILIYNYGVTHVPALVVVRKNGNLVTKGGVKDIEDIGINVLVTWTE